MINLSHLPSEGAILRLDDRHLARKCETLIMERVPVAIIAHQSSKRYKVFVRAFSFIGREPDNRSITRAAFDAWQMREVFSCLGMAKQQSYKVGFKAAAGSATLILTPPNAPPSLNS